MGSRLRALAPWTAAVVGAALALAPPAAGAAAPPDPGEAGRRVDEGDCALALERSRTLALGPASVAGTPGSHLDRAVACLARLGRAAEGDALRERFGEVHAADWRAIADLAGSWADAVHEGAVVAGRFERGPARGGRPVSSFERDRARALRAGRDALRLAGADRLDAPPLPAPASPGERSALRLGVAALLMRGRERGDAWRLRELTALDGPLPELEDARGRGQGRGAAVGPDGAPLFHAVPARWEDAASDGERWRWLLEAARVEDPSQGPAVAVLLADFARSQFGVQTLSGSPGLLARGDGQPPEAPPGPWDLSTLEEDETVARLATGVRRFRLPRDYDFVGAYRALSARPDDAGAHALRALAEIFESRRQHGRAAEAWRRSIAAFGGADSEPGRRLARIVEPRGEFEGQGTFVAGEPARVRFRFRNARSVRLEARRLDVPRLLADVRDHLAGDSPTLERERVGVEEIGWRVVARGQEQYRGEVAASWEQALEPLPDHRERGVLLETPLAEPGAYLLAARVDGGHESRVVVWVSDTVLVRKPLDRGEWYFAADAATGEPLPGLELDFFGYRQEPADLPGGGTRVRTRSFRAATDHAGQLVPDPELLAADHAWLVSATGAGRLAHLGWGPVWGERPARAEYRATKAYAITDRPSYRPGELVRTRLWVLEARFDAAGPSPHAGRAFTLQLHDPRGVAVLERAVETDASGGVTAEHELPADAAPGTWRVGLAGYGGGTFRVEERRAPPFEVAVEGPPGPVELGGTATAVVRARHRSGAPVAGSVLYRVRRTPLEAVAYPEGRWDWCYGPGSAWLAEEYPWYPGWEAWGTPRPRAPGRQRPAPPPELVAEHDVPLDPGGEARVEIDTALARALHGDTDHRYEIVAEVTDRARRTAVGSGEVLAARRPLRVSAWVDRGHYRAGDTVRAGIEARAAGGGAAGGVAQVALHSVDHAGGAPAEKTVRRWTLRLDAAGRARLQFPVAVSGQYRLAAAVTDAAGGSAEGGSVFVVAGPALEAADVRFNDLELVPDRPEYAPGDTVELRVNAQRRGAAVLLFVRPENGVYAPPRLLRLEGRSALERIEVGRGDTPDFFVEALTVSGGRVHTVLREILVPPAQRALDVEVLPSSGRYAPGEEARVRLRVTGSDGAPAPGTAVLAVFDRAEEPGAGGGALPDVRAFFWKWRREHAPAGVTSADRRFGPLHRGDEAGPPPTGAAGAASAGGGGGVPSPPPVRRASAVTAHWSPALAVGADGTAEAVFRMPERLADWTFRAWALGDGAAVGEGAAAAVTAKDVLVRLEAPRFLVERDETVLSASVRAFGGEATAVQAELELGGGSLEAVDGASRTLEIPPGGEARAQWRVRAVREGEAVVRVRALAPEGSDAAELRLPVLVRGAATAVGWSGSLHPGADAATFAFEIPAARRVDRTRLEVRLAPSIAAALLDALPSLGRDPRGSTEQTLDRFVPAAVLQRALRGLGVPLDESGLAASVRAGLGRLEEMQVADGGWGWFSGRGERSGPHTTAVVVRGLQAAAAAGQPVPAAMLERGLAWLERWQEREVGRLRGALARAGDWKERADELDALVFATLAEAGRGQAAMRGFLVRDRARLAPAGLAHLGLGLERQDHRDLLAATLRALAQHAVDDPGSRTVRLRLPGAGAGGAWWGGETESLAAYLRLLARTEPRGERAEAVARSLLGSRRNGTHWDATRATALSVEALAQLLLARGERGAEGTVEVLLDGGLQRQVRLGPDDLLAPEATLVVEGAALAAGPHTLEVRRRGAGPLHAAASLTSATLEPPPGEAGAGLGLRRAAHRLRPGGGDGAGAGLERDPLADGGEIAGGDLVEVELTLDAARDHEYVVVEDPRAAGLEPVEGQGGYGGDGAGAYLELRDTGGVFFLRELPRGTTSLRYRLRAGAPGRYVALPARVFAMYAPGLRATSDALRLSIGDGRR